MYVVVEYIAETARREVAWLVDVIVAPSRGRAKSIFTQLNRDHIDYTDIKSCRIVGYDVDRPEGPVDGDDSLWEAANVDKYGDGAE